MARLFKATYTKLRTLKDHRGNVVYDVKAGGRKVPRRVPVLGKDGKPLQVESKKWYIEYTDADGKPRRKVGFADRMATEQMAAKLERQVERRQAGVVDVDVTHLQTPLEDHIAAYVADLARSGRDDMYVYTVGKRLRKLAKECGWTTLASVRVEGLTQWLKDQKNNKDAAPRTLNQYVQTAAAMMNWTVGQKRAEVNPLAHVAMANEADKRRVRRALTADEIERLLARAGDRRLVYLTALLTGLRRSELAALVWGDVRLERVEPLIALRAMATKSRRADIVRLSPQLAQALREARPEDVADDARVFPNVPSIYVFKADLEAAGIDYKDTQGRQADFHALRVTFGTILAQSGMPIRTAMELMRHTDIRLTTRNYTDPTLLNTAGAVRSLPRLGDGREPEAMKATGTYHDRPEQASARLADCLAEQRTLSPTDRSPSGTEGRTGTVASDVRKPLEIAAVVTTPHQKTSPRHSGSAEGSGRWGSRIRT